jgi:hypothetical protein
MCQISAARAGWLLLLSGVTGCVGGIARSADGGGLDSGPTPTDASSDASTPGADAGLDGGPLGWFEIPNTPLASSCPSDPTIQGVTGCAAVISAWGGAAADTSRSRMLIWGGGHNDYYGNEVYALDLVALTMSRIIDPTTSPALCVEAQADGHPSSRHTYDDLTYLASSDKMLSVNGACACPNGGGCVSSAAWALDLPTLKWSLRNPDGGPPPTVGQAFSAYDPNSRRVFVFTMGQVWAYDDGANTYVHVQDTGLAWDGYKAVVDPRRQLFFLIGAGAFTAMDISDAGTYAVQDWSQQVTGCGGLMASSHPGVAYDPVQDKLVGWVGGNSVYLFDGSSKTCSTVTYDGGPGAAQGAGTYGRFAYFPALNLFALVNDWHQNAFTLRLTP